MSKKAKAEKNTVTFREYVERSGAFATPEAAVSVLMPVANELRAMHEAGRAHLELSPESVYVENGGLRLREPTGSAAPVPGFAAPEIYGGGDCGEVSDVYSFCALLRYAVDGKAPEDAITRASAGTGTLPPAYAYAEAYSVTSIRRITEKGMRSDPDKRYGTMQELIYDLMPFNRMQGWKLPAGKPARAAKTARRRRVRRPVLAAVLGLFGVAVLLLGVLYGGYIRSLALTMKGRFSEAWKVIPLHQVVKVIDSNYPDYVRAGMAYEKGDFADAAERFAGLGSYRKSEELRLEALYRQAAVLAESGDYDGAMELYAELAENDYGNSSALARDMLYRKAERMLEEENYEEAYTVFTSLAEARHADAAEMADETLLKWAHALADDGDLLGAYGVVKRLSGSGTDYAATVMRRLYAEAQDRYRDGEYAAAAERFAALSPYADSERYLVLMQCRNFDLLRKDERTSWESMPGAEYLGESRFSSAEDVIEALLGLIEFEDARTILTDRFTVEYLQGRWVTTALTYDLRMTESGQLTFSLPHYRTGGDFVVEEGEVRAYSGDGYTPVLAIYPVSRTEMEVYCHKDGQTYSMRRQW